MVEKKHDNANEKPSFRSSVRFVRLVWGRYPKRCALITGFLILAGFGEAISIAALLPLLGIVAGGNETEATAIHKAIGSMLEMVGLEVTVVPLLGLIIAGSLLKAGLMLLAGLQVGYATARVATDMRLGVMRSMLQAHWLHFSSQSVGRLSNAISGEAERASTALHSIGSLINNAVQVTVYLAFALVMSWQGTLLAVVVGGLITFMLRRTVTHTRIAGQEVTNALRALTARFADGLQGIKPLKAMACEGSLMGFLEAENAALQRSQEKRVFNKWLLRAAPEPVIIIFLALGVYLALSKGGIAIETLMIIAFLFNRTVNKISVLQANFQAIVSTESAFIALDGTIQEAKAEAEELAGARTPELKQGITLDHVSFAYGGHSVLHDVSVFIPSGQFTAIIGPSGSGKTTLVDLIVGLVSPQEGAVLCDGYPLSELNQREWRRSIGYVPQDLFLFHGDLATNVSLGDPDVSDEDVVEALKAADAWDFVSELPEGIHSIAGERGLRLSGGQRQRVAIARALVRRPRLLILDEATTALDPKTEAAVCESIRRFSANITVLAISHQPALTGIAQKVYRIANGRVTEQVEKQRQRVPR